MLEILSTFFFLSALVIPGLASGEPTQLTPGLYRIVNPGTGSWARNFPGPGHQGPWRSNIAMTMQFSSVYQRWNITPYEEGNKIRNYGSGNSAFSTGRADDLVEGFSDGVTKWYIEPAGGREYRVHYPNKDLVWTVQFNEGFGNLLALEPEKGEDSQLFEFTDFEEVIDERVN